MISCKERPFRFCIETDMPLGVTGAVNDVEGKGIERNSLTVLKKTHVIEGIQELLCHLAPALQLAKPLLRYAGFFQQGKLFLDEIVTWPDFREVMGMDVDLSAAFLHQLSRQAEMIHMAVGDDNPFKVPESRAVGLQCLLYGLPGSFGLRARVQQGKGFSQEEIEIHAPHHKWDRKGNGDR
jgi:hypothetical protein